MKNRYDHLYDFLNETKPKKVAELGLYDIDVTRKIYEILSNIHHDEFYILMMGNSEKIKKYKNFFHSYTLKSNNHYLLFFDLEQNIIDLNSSFDIGGKKISFKDFEFVVINDFDELNDYISSLEIFNNSKYYFIDRYFLSNDYEILNKGCFYLLENVDHVPLQKTDTLIIKKNENENEMVETACCFIRNENDELKNIAIKNLNSESNKLKLVPDKILLLNLNNNLNNFKNLKNLTEIKNKFLPTNEYIAHLVGSGPSLNKVVLDKLKDLTNSKNHIIFSTKSSLNILLQNDIIPFGCILTDPRIQVLDYLKKINNLDKLNITFFVSSLCDKEIFNYLDNLNVKICYFNEVNDLIKNSEFYNKLNKHVNVDMGCTSVISGINLLSDVFGFININLYGVDSSYNSETDEIYGISKHKRKTKVNLKLDDRNELSEFFSDIELIRQCIEMKKIIDNKKINLKNYFDEGLIKHLFVDKRTDEKSEKLSTFNKFFNC